MGKSKDIQTFKEILDVLEKRSTCERVQVGAILAREGRILATGWNGVPSGRKHCEDIKPEDHKTFSNQNEIHAEANCLGFAGRHGVRTEGAELYVTVSPCLSCAKMIESHGIYSVYYKREYDRSAEGIRFLKQRCNISTRQIA